jgi:hypothetical protein
VKVNNSGTANTFYQRTPGGLTRAPFKTSS